MPIFYPGNTQETFDYGLLAIALSRFSGAWVAMKMVTNGAMPAARSTSIRSGSPSTFRTV